MNLLSDLAAAVRKDRPMYFERHAATGAPAPGERGYVAPQELPSKAWSGWAPLDLAQHLVDTVHALWEDYEFAQAANALQANEWLGDDDPQDLYDELPDMVGVPTRGPGGELLSQSQRLDLVDLAIDIVRETRCDDWSGWAFGPAMGDRELAHRVRRGRPVQREERWRSEHLRDGCGAVPKWAAAGLLADWMDPRGEVRLVNVPKAEAEAFVARHHSAYPDTNWRGAFYALGAVRGDRLVAVAVAGTPTSPGRDQRDILELSRVASDGTTRNAASMLVARILRLLPRTGRSKLVTYQLVTEAGTTYRSLRDLGLRPVALVAPRAAGGARKGTGKGKDQDQWKIRWEAGPGAAAADWSLLEKTAMHHHAEEAELADAGLLERYRTPLLVGGALVTGLVLLKFLGGKGATVSGPRRVAALGDSITADGLYLAELAKHLPAGSQVKAFGYVGKPVEVIEQHLPEVLAWNPTDVIVLAGVNNVAGGGKSDEKAAAGLTRIWNALKSRGVRVIALKVLPWGGYPTSSAGGQAATARLNTFIGAAKLPDLVLDATDLLGDGTGKLKAQWKGDGLHPSPVGKAALGRWLAEQAFRSA